MKKTIQIGPYTVGDGQPCFIIAEAGVNHNGDPDLAKKLILKAKEVGADCVKFQTFKAERVVTEGAPKARYQLETTDARESQIDMLRKLELPLEAYEELIELCHQQAITFLSTPYNNEDVDLLDRIGTPGLKMASISIVEPPFLRYAAGKNKPIIASTGLATLEEVRAGVEAIRSTGNQSFVILQCTTNYPTAAEDANVRAMQTIREELDVLVGYSDHTQSDTACLVAVALGACVIEKHFTLDKSLPGPDQSSSADPVEFAQLVNNIRETEATLGSGVKEPCDAEAQNAEGMRRSVVAKIDIASGTKITESLLTLKRPASGLAPKYLRDLVGKIAQRDLAENTLLSPSDVS